MMGDEACVLMFVDDRQTSIYTVVLWPFIWIFLWKMTQINVLTLPHPLYVSLYSCFSLFCSTPACSIRIYLNCIHFLTCAIITVIKNSGRTEKQAMRDAMNHNRTPPAFKRTPSRRQPRRCIDELIDSKFMEANGRASFSKQEIKSVSIPQPAQA